MQRFLDALVARGVGELQDVWKYSRRGRHEDATIVDDEAVTDTLVPAVIACRDSVPACPQLRVLGELLAQVVVECERGHRHSRQERGVAVTGHGQGRQKGRVAVTARQRVGDRVQSPRVVLDPEIKTKQFADPLVLWNG